ncbi:Inositol-pentakisphosphate 2-kinase [Bertholletia excelsa]
MQSLRNSRQEPPNQTVSSVPARQDFTTTEESQHGLSLAQSPSDNRGVRRPRASNPNSIVFPDSPLEWMEVVLGKKDARDWVYRGEGAANLVLGYNGSSPAFVGKVLRIQKASRDGSPRFGSDYANDHSALTTDECLLWKEMEDLVSAPTREIAELLYVKHVMRPLLGSIDAGTRVIVSLEFLESVEKSILSQRPSWRVDAAKVNTLCDSALLMSDHTGFPHGNLKGEFCISVEIKPKCGFLPDSKFISEGSIIKKSITRFKMHQALKLHEKEISEISKYDPIDLFSGSKDRVYKAIKDLFVTPQNNFRVFLNGSLVFGNLGGGANSTSCMTGEALEDVLKPVIQAESGLRTANFLHLVAKAVYGSRLLVRLLEVQKLDIFDIEGAIHVYYNIVSQPCMVCRDLGKDKFADKFLYLHSLPVDESLKIVRNYLIAATAKDLSIMIGFRPREKVDVKSLYSGVFLESTNQTFDYKASFIDLDMKPLKKMEHYYELDKKIVSRYNQMVKEKQACKRKVMKLISAIEGIDSIVLDPSKNTVTVIGEADPVCIINKVRKFRKCAEIKSVGPSKEEKPSQPKPPEISLPRTCQGCSVWNVVHGDIYSPCNIL